MWYTNNQFWSTNRLYRWSHRLTYLFCKVMGDIEARGVHNIPREGGALIVANHVSLLDPLFVGSVANREMHYMARSDLFGVPGLSKLIRTYNAFPVNRGRPDIGALRKTIPLLKAGNAVLIFPEGTRSWDGELGKAHDGSCFIAHHANVPTIPVYHRGAEKLLPRGSMRLRRAKLDLAFGEPIDFSGIVETDVKREMYQKMGVRMIDALVKLRDQMDNPDV